MRPEERLAAGSRAPLSDGGGAASGRGRAGGASRRGLDRVRVRVEARVSDWRRGTVGWEGWGVGESAAGRWDG